MSRLDDAGSTSLSLDDLSRSHASPADFNLTGRTTNGGVLTRSPHAVIFGRRSRYSRQEQEFQESSPSPCSYDTTFPSISRSPDARIVSQPTIVFSRAGRNG